MILNPIRAYRLAAQAEQAFAARDRAAFYADSLSRANLRLHQDLRTTRVDLAAANAKVARMTSGLKRGASKAA